MSVTKPIILDETGRAIADSIRRVASAISSKNGTIYGFHVNGNEADPSAKITYLKDAIGMTPAKMDYANGVFDYGSWGDAFFMPKPCMVRSNGMVDYYLNPNNYAQKDDGSASDISSDSYDGNAMMEWGKIYIKIVPSASDDSSADILIADYKADSGFRCWSNINNNGIEVDHFYTPIYNGYLDGNNRLRSLSGKTIMRSKSGTQEISYAQANNPSGMNLWYIETFADIQLITFLLMLIGKSADSQRIFGNGHYTGGSEATMLTTGTMDSRGLFWGTNGTGNGVKVFGMENFWGNQWRRYAGHIMVNGDQRVKLTWGTADGSTADGYNTTGSGYISIGSTPSGTNGGYINKMSFSSKGMVGEIASGSSSTHYCDGLWFNNGITAFALRGGACTYGLLVGLFCCSLDHGVGSVHWAFGSSVSCKPSF